MGLSLLLLSTPPAAAETIQLEREHGVYMVPVLINGIIPMRFILDSGAAEVAIPEDVFSVLIRSKTVSESDFLGTGTYILADGSAQSSRRFVLHSVAVGDHVITNVVANVVSVKGDPLLGQSFLSKLPGWSIDNARHALVLNGAAGTTAEQPAPLPPLTHVKTEAEVFFGRGFQAYQSQDYAQALQWYRKAAEQGYPQAQTEIGLMIAHGYGVAKDCTIARQWLERAAAAGDAYAQLSLRYGAGGKCPLW